MNKHEIDRIAAAMHQLRPDWPVASLRTLLNKPVLRDRPRRDVTVALAWVACESGTATPARVIESGPWWRAASIEGQATRREILTPAERCSVCSQHEDRCRALAATDPDPHEFLPAAHAARQQVDATQAKTITDALRAEVQPLREPSAPIDLAERRTTKSAATRAAIQHPEEPA